MKAKKITDKLEKIKIAIVSASKVVGEPGTESAIEICAALNCALQEINYALECVGDKLLSSNTKKR